MIENSDWISCGGERLLLYVPRVNDDGSRTSGELFADYAVSCLSKRRGVHVISKCISLDIGSNPTDPSLSLSLCSCDVSIIQNDG